MGFEGLLHVSGLALGSVIVLDETETQVARGATPMRCPPELRAAAQLRTAVP